MNYCMGCMETIEENVETCPYCGFMQKSQNVKGLLQTGTILQNRYIVGRSIGNGGFGVTYIGLDAQLKRKIAIKEFFPRKTSARMQDGMQVAAPSIECQQAFNRGLEQFLNEAKHLARLSHIQGIVYIYNFFQQNGTGYIIMEYLEGQDLRNLLHQHNERLSFDEARELILSVLYILKNVHMNGILHRDIAPDNVFITDDKIVKLIDFGAARHAVRQPSEDTDILLKVGYAPVEQYYIDGKQGAWTDMYEVGALFYRMLTGIKPIPSIDRAKQDTLKLPSELGVELPDYAEAAIMTSLNIDSRYRIQSARDYMHALRGDSFQPTEWTVETTLFEQDELEKKHRVFSKKRIVLLAIICLLIVSSGLFVAGKLKKNADVVVTNNKELPELKGKTEQEATEELKKLGVENIHVVYVFDVTGKETVEDQNPAPGGNVAAQSEITITVKSSQKTVLPSLSKGTSYANVKNELQEKGLQVEKQEKYNDDVDKDNVIGYDGYTEDQVLDAGTTVRLNVSLGSKKDYERNVPDLDGLTIKEAKELCKKDSIPYKIDRHAKEDYIVNSQSIKEGKSINVREDVLKITGKKKEKQVEAAPSASKPNKAVKDNKQQKKKKKNDKYEKVMAQPMD